MSKPGGWGWFFAGVALGGVVLPLALGVLWLVTPGRMPQPSEEALTAAETEGTYLLHVACEAVQGYSGRTGNVPFAIWGEHANGSCGLQEAAMTGQHYVIVNGIDVLPTGELELVAVPLAGEFPLLRMRFLPMGAPGEVIAEPHPRD